MNIDLRLGDCLQEMKNIDTGSIDMILADPPYGTTDCKWDTVIPLEPMWEQLKRIIKPNGAIVMTASQPFTTTLIASNIKMFKYCWVWDKIKPSGFQTAKFRPMMRQEDIVVFCKGATKYYPIMTDREKVKKSKPYKTSDSSPLKYSDGKNRVYTQKYPQSIIEVSNANQKGKLHPTQKPVALMEYLIKTYTKEGETVLDFTMGSGTTGVACMNTNRNFIGIEIDENYFAIAKEKVEEKRKEKENQAPTLFSELN
jgi:site-specific DNA-methyltransferase (adenine-specific)